MGVSHAIAGVPLIKIILRIYVKRLQPILRFPATNYAILTLFSYTLSFGRYVQVQLCVYTWRDAYHTSSFYTVDYGSLAAIWNCNEMMSSPDEIIRQKTLEHLLLDRLVTKPRHIDDAYDNFPSFGNRPLAPWSILHKINVYRLVSARLAISEIPGRAFIKELHIGFSAVYHCVAYSVSILRCHHSDIAVYD